MTKGEVMRLLEAQRDERGVRHWERLGLGGDGALTSFGIGLTTLRKLAKQVGRDHGLAMALWDEPVYDAKVVALLVDEPKRMTREQAEAQVGGTGIGMLGHVFSSCDAPLAKAPFAGELAAEWTESDDPVRRRCGWGLVYELSKTRKRGAPDDAFYARCIERVRREIHGEENGVRDAMLGALFGIGKRDRALNAAAIAAAEAIGPVDIDYGDTGCEPIDVVKHLKNPGLQERLRG